MQTVQYRGESSISGIDDRFLQKHIIIKATKLSRKYDKTKDLKTRKIKQFSQMLISADRRVDAEDVSGVVDVVGVDQMAFPKSKSSSLSD